MVVVTDILDEPFDEGTKISTFYLLKEIKLEQDAFVVCVNRGKKHSLADKHIPSNRLLANKELFFTIKESGFSGIIYIPASSATPAAIVRAWVLSLFSKKRVSLLSYQPREFGLFSRVFLPIVSPGVIITQSRKSAQDLSEQGFQSRFIPMGVDVEKFKEQDRNKRSALRRKYGISNDQIVLLHVGHIRESRNLEWMLQVKKKLPEVYVIVVGSSYGKKDQSLCDALVRSGIMVMGEFVPDMGEIYNLTDFYVWPVLCHDGAIETPLSVLEAMACNVPVISTRFGSLPETFKQDNGFFFVETWSEIVDILERPY